MLWTPPSVEPREVEPGLYRVTFNAGPDVARGVTPDGEGIVYVSLGLPTEPSAWRLLIAPVAGGPAREEAELYRRAVRQPVLTMTYNAAGRVVAFARGNGDGEIGCTPCFLPADDLPVLNLVLYQLPVVDGPPLSQLPALLIIPPLRRPISGDTIFAGEAAPVPLIGDTVRVTAAQLEAHRLGVNPFGPVAAPDSAMVVYSDGETVFRIDLAANGVPVPVTSGAFPALSFDGTLLAVARPVGLDSTTSSCSGRQNGGALCQLVTISHVVSTWETVVYDLATLSPQFTVRGTEPRFHPDGSRIVVRRGNGLFWVDLSGGAETMVPHSGGAYAVAVSPTGNILAFTLDRFGNADVFFARLDPGS